MYCYAEGRKEALWKSYAQLEKMEVGLALSTTFYAVQRGANESFSV